ncbi:MAG TPA: hypothetical protein VHQ86_03865 [Candidatus Saccharimonadia bacterium]|jgi:hypothetical protein|nr:hypothetical protein [Candidatus Saccharimonadia bacterium]
MKLRLPFVIGKKPTHPTHGRAYFRQSWGSMTYHLSGFWSDLRHGYFRDARGSLRAAWYFWRSVRISINEMFWEKVSQG